MVDIMRARLINYTLGGAFVEPGEVADLPPEFIEAIQGLTSDLGEMKKGFAKEEDIFAKWRQSHPTYRK
jgi:hypothetical protein